MLSVDVNGTAWERRTFVEIRWQWLILLAAQVGLSAVTLLVIIVETARSDMEIVKGSPLAALFAISAEEKAAVERGQEAEPLTRADEAHIRPAGIAGELKKRHGRWILDAGS